MKTYTLKTGQGDKESLENVEVEVSKENIVVKTLRELDNKIAIKQSMADVILADISILQEERAKIDKEAKKYTLVPKVVPEVVE